MVTPLTFTLNYKGRSAQVSVTPRGTTKDTLAAIRVEGCKVFDVVGVRLNVADVPIDGASVAVYNSTRLTGEQQSERRLKLNQIGRSSAHPALTDVAHVVPT